MAGAGLVEEEAYRVEEEGGGREIMMGGWLVAAVIRTVGGHGQMILNRTVLRRHSRFGHSRSTT